MTRRELLRRMDAAEINDWVAFDRVHVPRAEELLATLCALTYNAHRDPKRSRMLTSDDFLGRPRRRCDVQRQFLAWAKARGA